MSNGEQCPRTGLRKAFGVLNKYEKIKKTLKIKIYSKLSLHLSSYADSGHWLISGIIVTSYSVRFINICVTFKDIQQTKENINLTNTLRTKDTGVCKRPQ